MKRGSIVLIGLVCFLSACSAAENSKMRPVGACTKDLHQCPDGSMVGRSGQDCQFVCPQPEQSGSGQIMCTMDAMQCPDGRWVGRSGPDCQFLCPNGEKEK